MPWITSPALARRSRSFAQLLPAAGDTDCGRSQSLAARLEVAKRRLRLLPQAVRRLQIAR
jgi:hypothetical protein